MDVIEKLEAFNRELKEISAKQEEIKQKRIEWCRENRKEIKKLYPKRDKVYEIVNPKNVHYLRYNNIYPIDGETYFFKPKSLKFVPHLDFNLPYGTEEPTVRGTILDCNLQAIIGDQKLGISQIKRISSSNSPKKLSKKITQVYVMIDKNTGYYKIGRSVNPNRRERTLQSEKPTIELLFNHDARVSDEKELHDMFADKRIRGEWFDLSGSDLNKVRNYFNCKEHVVSHL